MPDSTGSASAGPALRGFRLQIVYTLARLIEAPGALRAVLYQPEAVEDLSIYGESGELLEAVQVKAYGAPLTLNDLEPNAPRGLLRRVLNALKRNPSVQVRLASFGPIGTELIQAWGGEGSARERIRVKLGRAGFSSDDLPRLLSRFSFEVVDESDITGRIETFLRSHPLLVGQVEHALASLCQWLYGAAEVSEKLTYADLIERVANVGRYIQERAAHWETWGKLILPLDCSGDNVAQPERLLAEFQQGMAAGYRHIQAGCDIPRVTWLDRLDRAFEKTAVVIVRAASGQGKSALAYRYLHDYCGGLWRFQIRRVENRQDALSIATALSGHAKAIGVPVTVYLDIQPGDRTWPELLQLLGQLPNLRVLVTVREEDWRRASLSGAEVVFQDIALCFDEHEARLLYEGLEKRGGTARFLAFEEAWRQFGGEGPLLEFVYLITQTQTLGERLRQQVRMLRDEVEAGRLPKTDLRLLALTAYASSLGARLDVQSLRRMDCLLDLGRSVERLEQEYLLRVVDEGACLDGLHPLRSNLLVECLCDGLTFDCLELARDCLPLLPSREVEVFLLHLAASQSGASMLSVLQGWAPPEWAAAGGVFRALLWVGLRDYVDLCMPLIDEVRAEFGDGWWGFLDLDLAELLPDTGLAMWKQLGELVPEVNQTRFQALIDRQPSKSEAFATVRTWLASLGVPPTPPSSLDDWDAIAEMGYWCGRWQALQPLAQWLREVSLDDVIERLPLALLARLLLGRWQLDSAFTGVWLRTHHEAIAARFRRETQTARVEERDGVVRAHFLVSWDALGETDQTIEKRSLHAEAMARVYLLRGLFPDRSRYGCQGYGHRLFPTDYDDTTKTAIKPENLPPDWAVEVNATVLALAKWGARLPDWDAYVAALWSRREAIVHLLHDVRRALEAHFRDRKKRQALQKRLDLSAWERLRDALSSSIALPCSAVDRWGFISEDRQRKQENGGKGRQERFVQQFALATYRDLLHEQGEVMRALQNFLNQAWPYLFLDHQTQGSEATSRQVIESYVTGKGQRIAEPRLTSLNFADFVSHLKPMQQAFDGLFSRRFAPERLITQDKREREEADRMLRLWPVYLEQPRMFMQDPLGQTKRQWESLLRDICHRIDWSLRDLTGEWLSAQRLQRPVEWEGKTALWLLVDVDDPVFLVHGALRFRCLLAEVVIEMAWPDHLRQALIRHWHSVVVVPTFRGKRIGDWAWVLPLLRVLFGAEDGSWLDVVQYPVADDVWEHLAIPKWETPEIHAATDLFRAIGGMQALMAQIGDWLPLVHEEGCDGHVLQGYVDKQAPEWSRAVQILNDCINAVLQLFLSLDPEQQSQRPFLAVAASNISENFSRWLPCWSMEAHPVLGISDIESWRITWKDHEAELFGVYFSLLMDAEGEASAG